MHVQVHSNWPFGKNEPELRSLYEWIDSRAMNNGYGKEWGIWGGVTGLLFGVAGPTVGVLASTNASAPPAVMAMMIGIPLGTAALASAVMGWVMYRRQSPARREANRAMADARTFAWQLVSARWQGNIKGLIGEDRALALNEGAAAYLRARQALNSTAWKAVSPDTEYAATRERTEVAMDVAMARLVTMIGQGAGGAFPEVRRLIKDMTEAADESTRTAERLSLDAGIPGNASDNLRQVLSEMRLLNSASDEYDRLRDRSS